MSPEREAQARAALTYLAEPGDPALGALLEVCEPAEVLATARPPAGVEFTVDIDPYNML